MSVYVLRFGQHTLGAAPIHSEAAAERADTIKKERQLKRDFSENDPFLVLQPPDDKPVTPEALPVLELIKKETEGCRN